MNPTVICSKHAQPFQLIDGETDHDGTQQLVKQYWRAACGCEIEITLAIPELAAA
jgi:hypothetical protein